MTLKEKALELVQSFEDAHYNLSAISNFTNIPIEFRITNNNTNESSKIVEISDLEECKQIIELFIEELGGASLKYSIKDHRLFKKEKGFMYLYFLL